MYVHVFINFDYFFFMYDIKNKNLFDCKLKIDSYWAYIIKNEFTNKIQNWGWLFVV